MLWYSWLHTKHETTLGLRLFHGKCHFQEMPLTLLLVPSPSLPPASNKREMAGVALPGVQLKICTYSVMSAAESTSPYVYEENLTLLKKFPLSGVSV